MDSSGSNLHGVNSRQFYDRLLVFVTLFAGIVGTFSFKYFDFPIAVQVLFPAAVLIIYALIASVFSNYSIEPEIVGDNCYYFGFIFTLVSMAYTLYGIYKTADNLDLVSGIVSGFGVALTSTIVGITLRVIFLQLRPDVVQSERVARQTLNESVNEFQREISLAVKTFSSFHVESSQQMVEYKKKLFENNKEFTGEFTDWVTDHLKTTSESHLKAVEERSNQEMEIYKNKMEQTLSLFADSVGKMRSSTQILVESIESDSTLICTRMKQAGERLEKQIGEIVALNTHQSSAIRKVLDEALDNSAKSSEALRSSWHEHAQEISTVSESIRASLSSVPDSIHQPSPMDTNTMPRIVRQDMTPVESSPSSTQRIEHKRKNRFDRPFEPEVESEPTRSFLNFFKR